MASRLEKEFTSLLRAVEGWESELRYGAEWGGEISVTVAEKMREEIKRLRELNIAND